MRSLLVSASLVLAAAFPLAAQEAPAAAVDTFAKAVESEGDRLAARHPRASRAGQPRSAHRQAGCRPSPVAGSRSERPGSPTPEWWPSCAAAGPVR